MKKIFLVIISIVTLGCSNSDDGPTDGGGTDNPDGGTDPVPTAASLVFPLESSVCTEGKDFTETTSTITFRWRAGDNSTNYKLVLTDIENNNSVEEFEATGTTTEVTLDVPMVRRGTQYMWKIISTNTTTDVTAESSEWVFFNAGVAVETYAPFPATAVTPERGEAIAATSKVTLDWDASDLDGNDDILEYDVYFGTTSPPELFTTITNSMLQDVDVVSGSTYFWRIVTKDKSNNESGSAVFEFSVN